MGAEHPRGEGEAKRAQDLYYIARLPRVIATPAQNHRRSPAPLENRDLIAGGLQFRASMRTAESLTRCIK
jgi:hypothetical protein